MTTYIYQEVKRQITLRGVCKTCGKKRTRTIAEAQTINPYNRNKDGSIKSCHEVEKSVAIELETRVKRFKEEGFICKGCQEYLSY